MKSIRRIAFPAADSRDANIVQNYTADRSYRVSYPGAGPLTYGVWQYKLEFTLEKDTAFTVYITADQRFEASLDGEMFAAGPDRSDFEHWSLAGYRIELSAGVHRFDVLHWNLRRMPPAQMNMYPFFQFAAEEEPLHALLNTGSGRWLVREIKGYDFDDSRRSYVFAHSLIDVRETERETPWAEPEVRVKPMWAGNIYGGRAAGHCLHPSNLPEQLHEIRRKGIGTVRAVVKGMCALKHVFTEAEGKGGSEWQAMIDGEKPLVVPPHTEESVLIDLNDYHCAYPLIEASGGAEESISVYWHEALVTGEKKQKLDRAAVFGYEFPEVCEGDTFRAFPERKTLCRPLWWRAGRFVLLHVKTGEKPLVLHSFGLREDRYPLEDAGRVSTSRKELEALLPMLRRTMQMCAHETFMDCPYYEQLMYVGDTRLEALTCFVMQREDALPRRAVELFNWSRHHWEGIVAEHYPSHIPQLSCTFAMIWVLMVRDLMLYRRVEEKDMVLFRTGIRTLIECLSEYIGEDGLIRNLPGWSFIDWVPRWDKLAGVPDCGSKGVCSIYLLQMIGTLRAAMEVERETGGEPLLIRRFEKMESRLKETVVRVFWNEKRGLFSDDPEQTEFSEHAQALALLYDVGTPAQLNICFRNLLKDPDLLRTTISYSFYLFDALTKRGFAHLIPDKMTRWHELLEKHAVTTWESPDPSRSDCHAWGSHPLYHIHSSLAGIRPASFGFRTVAVKPCLGDMEYLAGEFPHPDGTIRYSYRRTDAGLDAELELPGDVFGVLDFQGCRECLKPGKNHFVFK